MSVTLIDSYEETIDNIVYLVQEYQSDNKTFVTIVRTVKEDLNIYPDPIKPPLPPLVNTGQMLKFIIEALKLKDKYSSPP